MNDEIKHYGVLGMKWGRRRHQNPDGSLTSKGKNIVSKAYIKQINKSNKQIAKTDTDRYFKSYNKAADDMNNGLIEKYNRDYDKKLGSKAKNHDYLNDQKYIDGYEKMFEKVRNRYYSELLYNDTVNNKNYKKAQKLVETYSMEKFDNIVVDNNKFIKDLRKRFK